LSEGRMASEQAARFEAWSLIKQWPPPADEVVLAHNDGVDRIVIAVESQGCFSLWIATAPGAAAMLFRSAPVIPSGPGDALFQVTYSGPLPGMIVSGVDLPAYLDGSETVGFPTRPRPIPSFHPAQHPGTPDACRDWVCKRKKKFAQPKLRKGTLIRREKSLQDQADELLGRVDNI